MACYKDTIRTKKPIKYHVWTTRPTQHHVRTFKTTPCHVRTIIPTNYNYLQLLQIMSGLSDPLHTHMTGLAKLLHVMTFITTVLFTISGQSKLLHVGESNSHGIYYFYVW